MSVLSLDSNRWGQLKHAYGPATDTPELLQKLYDSPNDDVWSDLFGTVLHQGDVTEAAYAALPHVVAASKSVPLAERIEYLAFAAAAVDGLDRKPCPNDLTADYEAAVESAREMAMEVLEHTALSDQEIPYVYEALAATNGLPTLARIVEGFSNEEFTFVCTNCGSWLHISTAVAPFRVYAEDPVRHPNTASIPITPSVRPSAVSEVPSNLLFLLGRFSAVTSSNQVVGSSHRDRRSRSTDAVAEVAKLPFNLFGRAYQNKGLSVWVSLLFGVVIKFLLR